MTQPGRPAQLHGSPSSMRESEGSLDIDLGALGSWGVAVGRMPLISGRSIFLPILAEGVDGALTGHGPAVVPLLLRMDAHLALFAAPPAMA